MLPLAARGILVASLLIFALAVSAFATPSLVGGARVQLMSTTIYEQMTELNDWPFAAAVAFILLAVVLGDRCIAGTRLRYGWRACRTMMRALGADRADDFLYLLGPVVVIVGSALGHDRLPRLSAARADAEMVRGGAGRSALC